MTATIRPPDGGSASGRPLRFSSLESLGFSNAASTWSETRLAISVRPTSRPSAPTPPVVRRGRHEAPPPEPDTVADWQPEDFGGRLTGGNTRWGLVAVIIGLLAGAAGFAYWVYQRPVALQEASATEVHSKAGSLEQALPVLVDFNQGLTTHDLATGTSSLFVVESEARALFDASSGLASTQSDLRRASSEAARSALDGVRLATEAHSYRVAVLPILDVPKLETDPSLIALDEAARDFGDWQLAFDNVRTALPDSVMSDVTRQLDALSADLSSILTSYVDALREDNTDTARTALSDLDERLGEINKSMDNSVEDLMTRVDTRIAEARHALQLLLGD